MTDAVDTAAIRAEHEAHNYRVTALGNPHDCDGCGAEGAAKWDVLWSNEGRDEEPFLCDDCLAREFREIRLCDALDEARAELEHRTRQRDHARRIARGWVERAEKAEARLAAVVALGNAHREKSLGQYCMCVACEMRAAALEETP